MDSPWEQTDCEVSEDVVRQALREQAPGLVAEDTVRYLSEGWDSWAFSAMDAARRDWILRFPKRAPVAERLGCEIALLPLLGPRLPLPIPQFALVGAPSAVYPHRFTGYRAIHGTPAVELAAQEVYPDGPLGKALAEFLVALHAFPVEVATAAGVPVSDHERDNGITGRLLHRFEAQLPPAALTEALRLLAAPVGAPAETVLVHNDFFPEHILLENGRPSGVIDFGDVALGDPAGDLAGLLYWQGEELLSVGLGHYASARRLSAADVAGMTARARVICVSRAAEDLDYGSRDNEPLYFEAGLRFLRSLARGA